MENGRQEGGLNLEFRMRNVECGLQNGNSPRTHTDTHKTIKKQYNGNWVRAMVSV
jgi:hypothetical protein